jgi:ABC-2 type transport system ATP-binding protein
MKPNACATASPSSIAGKIALGSPAQLIAQLGGEHSRLPLTAATAQLDGKRIGGLPTVRSARQTGESYSLAIEQPHIALPAVLALLQAKQLALASLTTRHATLEDVFVSLTGRHLQEGNNGAP